MQPSPRAFECAPVFGWFALGRKLWAYLYHLRRHFIPVKNPYLSNDVEPIDKFRRYLKLSLPPPTYFVTVLEPFPEPAGAIPRTCWRSPEKLQNLIFTKIGPHQRRRLCTKKAPTRPCLSCSTTWATGHGGVSEGRVVTRGLSLSAWA